MTSITKKPCPSSCLRDNQQQFSATKNWQFRLQGKCLDINFCLKTNFALLVIMIGLISLSGCGTHTTRSYSLNVPASWPDTQSKLSAFTHWQLQGKLAVIQADRSDSVIINKWQQSGDQYDIIVSSAFLGLGTTQLMGRPDKLTIVQPDEPVISSSSPDLLLENSLGWSLPVNSLSHWIKGLPTPYHPAEMSFDAEGNPYQIKQASWQIGLDRYQNLNGLVLPTKITLSDGDIKIKVIVTEWTSQCQGCS